jgi:ribonucleoside-diphosphate reductase alpha chain
MAGVRTPIKQFSSCTLIDCGDSLDSINASASAIVKFVAKRAGIGLNVGRIRAENSPIRNGDTMHTGLIPFIKYFQAATNSCNQGGLRKGSATINFPIWRIDIEDLIVLKNNKGTDDNRARFMDYCV